MEYLAVEVVALVILLLAATSRIKPGEHLAAFSKYPDSHFSQAGLINVKFANDEIVIDIALVVDRTSWQSTPHLQDGAISGWLNNSI